MGEASFDLTAVMTRFPPSPDAFSRLPWASTAAVRPANDCRDVPGKREKAFFSLDGFEPALDVCAASPFLGIVKWIPAASSFGFVSSTAFVEDLFFHESHVKGLRTLLQHDRVAFSIRRNPLTGKINAVNLVLLDRPSASNMGSCACPPAHGPAATLGAECPVLESSAQVARRMSALGFSRLQIEDLLSFTGASAGHQNHHPRGPAAVSVGPSPELQAQRDAGFAPQMAMGRNAPRYFKTKLCKFFQSVPGCPRGARCRFAHGVSEIRCESPAAGAL